MIVSMTASGPVEEGPDQSRIFNDLSPLGHAPAISMLSKQQC
jgi:hypothetical protein